MSTPAGSNAQVPETLPDPQRSLNEVIESLWAFAETERVDKSRKDHHVEFDKFAILWDHPPVEPGFYNIPVMVKQVRKLRHCCAWRQGDITHFFYTYTDNEWHPSRPGISK